MKKRYPTYDEAPKPQRAPGALWSLLSVLLLLGVACTAFYFVLVFTNPYTSLNPFPPTPPSAAGAASATPTELAFTLPPILTPPVTLTPIDNPAPTATDTLAPTPTPITLTPTPS
ncbi:MAG: hypothetical protein ACKOC5_17675, partial [Chloroflexota bacterium]